MTTGRTMLRRVGTELVSAAGLPQLLGGFAPAAAILKFGRVRPKPSMAFHPLSASESDPELLDTVIGALRRWRYDIVPLSDIVNPSSRARRVVCLTFDSATRDFDDFARPVLERLDVPFALFVPTAFPDGIGTAWWTALEQLIQRQSRIILMIGREERRFSLDGSGDKAEAFLLLWQWLRGLSAAERTSVMADLCRRYGVDLAAISRKGMMSWDDIQRIASNPLATIGTSTVHYSPLAPLSHDDALREMRMGRAVAEAALGRPARYFAYPFGQAETFGARDVVLAEEAGFELGLTAVPGTLRPEQPVLALPRISIDRRLPSLRALRVSLAGLMLPSQRPF
jgi:peptidoglycan/xylan/chitin deacetylase (PgdA/CDA1 family)